MSRTERGGGSDSGVRAPITAPRTKEKSHERRRNASAVRHPARPRPAGGRRILRRVGAVLAGLVAIFAVTTVTDAVMHATGVFPPVGAPPMSSALFLLAFAYRFVFDVAGCWLTARLAPDRPMRHALVLGAIGLVLSIAGAVGDVGRGTRAGIRSRSPPARCRAPGWAAACSDEAEIDRDHRMPLTECSEPPMPCRRQVDPETVENRCAPLASRTASGNKGRR